MKIHHKSRRLLSTCLIGAVVFVVAAVLLVSYRPSTSTTAALSGSEFQPGRIIDDAVFYNKDTMSAEQIQTFLNQKVPACDTLGEKIYSGTKTRAQSGIERGNPPPFICLKDYKQDIPEKAAGNYCDYLPAAADQTAAQIIYSVSQACGVNPQVLLVLLQKEQSLITDDWPFTIQYRSATGYGCPDTAPCDAQYYGFFNQIYRAAWQYKVYRANPNSYNYRAGRNNYIQYNPNASCGGETIFIENQATAGLYIYTPYIPNAKALSNLYGIGDSCSAYGNRNFWRLFREWFGNTQGERYSNMLQPRILTSIQYTCKLDPVVILPLCEGYDEIEPGEHIRFAQITTLADGRTCLRTKFDTDNKIDKCILYERLTEFSPTYEDMLPSDLTQYATRFTCKVHMGIGAVTNQCFEVGDRVDLSKQVTVFGQKYFITPDDVNQQTLLGLLSERLVQNFIEDYSGFMIPRNLKVKSSTTRKISLPDMTADQELSVGQIIHFSRKININHKTYYQTTSDATFNINRVIDPDNLSEI